MPAKPVPGAPGGGRAGGADGACGQAGPAALRVLPATELDRRLLGQLELVYEEAFPAHLRVPLSELAAKSSRDQLLVGLAGDDVAGFAAVRWLTTAGWVFLRYYGVAAKLRRQRLGWRFWQLLAPLIAASGWPARIAFEVEDPADVPGDYAEQAVRRGRIAFWESCGAVTLPVPLYVMPALTELGTAEPMILMCADPEQPAGPPAADLAVLVEAIYAEHYGLPPGHSLMTAAVESIAGGSSRLDQ
jgi:hypothetical protein